MVPNCNPMIKREPLSGKNFHLIPHDITPSEAHSEAIQESWEELKPWMRFIGSGFSREERDLWLETRKDDWIKGTSYDFGIYDSDDAFIGNCGLNNINRDNALANLGYWVRTSATGKGAATEAVALLADFGFNTLKLTRLEILMAEKNLASQRVAIKVGAKREGILRNRLIVGENIYNAVMFSLIPEDIV